MYGCNKLYCEMLGSYFSRHYRQLAAQKPVTIDFRCVLPWSAQRVYLAVRRCTSDYGPEMVLRGAASLPLLH